MSDVSPTPQPIVVPTTYAPALGGQGLRVLVISVCAIAADRFVKNDMLLPAVMAGAGVLGTWAAGAWQHIKTINLFQRINAAVSDRLVKAK
jgi:hypothetical protein